MAVRLRVMIGGDDFKSGQTKMKSVLTDFLIGAGIKPTSIVRAGGGKQLSKAAFSADGLSIGSHIT